MVPIGYRQLYKVPLTLQQLTGPTIKIRKKSIKVDPPSQTHVILALFNFFLFIL